MDSVVEILGSQIAGMTTKGTQKSASYLAGAHANQKDDETSLDVRACSLCHCALDYTDKAAFNKDDRWEDYSTDANDDADDDDGSYFFRRNDPYLPKTLEDPTNALLYCDSCPRLFHQQCHFVPVLTFHPSKPWHCLLCQVQKQQTNTQGQKKKKRGLHRTVSYPYDIMFQSPPIAAAKEHEQAWEQDPLVVAMKVAVLSMQLQTSYPRALSTPLSSYKRAMVALETLGHAQRNKRKLPLLSQQLIQSISTAVNAKCRIRTLVNALEHVRLADAPRQHWNQLLEFVAGTTGNDNFCQRVIFPFGSSHGRRWSPVSPEYKSTSSKTKSTPVPLEIVVATPRRSRRNAVQPEEPVATAIAENNDDDASFSLDELQCSFCLGRESSDANDMILCDGHGCFRACHMQCVQLTVVDPNADWFCPFCVCLSTTLDRVYEETNDDDEAGEDDGSWEGPQDVFPEADWESTMTSRLKAGDHGPGTDRLIKRFLGIEEETGDGDGDDDDNVDEDGHFDLYSYEEERRIEKDEQSEAASSHSSKATLGELSSVVQSIAKDELKALVAEGDGDDDVNTAAHPKARRRRSQRGVLEEHSPPEDPGRMDPTNIVEGKRKRKRVDYRKLYVSSLSFQPSTCACF